MKIVIIKGLKTVGYDFIEGKTYSSEEFKEDDIIPIFNSLVLLKYAEEIENDVDGIY